MTRMLRLIPVALSMTGCLALDISDLEEASWPPVSTAPQVTSTPSLTPDSSPGASLPPDTSPPDSSPSASLPPHATPTLEPGSSPRPTLPPTPGPTATMGPPTPTPPPPTPSLPPTPPPDLDEDGFSPSEGDCNDLNSLVYPGATEKPYDNVDQDCSGSDLQDVDADGSTSTVVGGLDCDDTRTDVYPGAEELCDGRDNNCDGTADSGTPVTLYADLDADTFGDDASPLVTCLAPDGYVLEPGDCNDLDAAAYPGAVEIPYDGIDQDCLDGDLIDADLDGFDAKPMGGTDCNDEDSTIYPGAPELCDGIDNDCNGATDEATATYYPDADGDGFGNPASPTVLCGKPAGYVSNATDCNDASATVYPGATEVSDALDNDCDGQIDQTSCKNWKRYNAGLPSGAYSIDPDGAGAGTPFQVYCDMSTSGGGWTLLALITNNDGLSWGPKSTLWVDTATLGSANALANADAKSRAYSELGVDELLIALIDGTREVQTATGCLSGRTMRAQMQVDSANSQNCARSCATVAVSGSFAQDYWCQDNVLKFRCRDANSSTTKPGGYLISNSDNSFLTTLINDSWCYDYSVGMGVSEYVNGGSNHADFGSTVSDNPDSSDKRARALYGR